MRTLLALVVLVTGLVLLWPMASTWMRGEFTRGQIQAFYTLPEADGRVRLLVCYELARRVDGVVERILAYGQADGLFQRIADPVVTPAEAARIVAQAGNRPAPHVWYEANDPAGSALIISPASDTWSRRYIIGGLLVLFGCGLILARRRTS